MEHASDYDIGLHVLAKAQACDPMMVILKMADVLTHQTIPIKCTVTFFFYLLLMREMTAHHKRK